MRQQAQSDFKGWEIEQQNICSLHLHGNEIEFSNDPVTKMEKRLFLGTESDLWDQLLTKSKESPNFSRFNRTVSPDNQESRKFGFDLLLHGNSKYYFYVEIQYNTQ